MGFWCESTAFAQVGVFRNNSSQGHNLKYYASSFCNAAGELVLEKFSVCLGAPGAPKWQRRSRCGPACPLLGNRGGSWNWLGVRLFPGAPGAPETGGEFGAVVPIAVSRTKPIIGVVRFRFFWFFAQHVWAPHAFFLGGFHGQGQRVLAHARMFSFIVCPADICKSAPRVASVDLFRNTATLRNSCASDWIHPSGPPLLGVVQCGLRHEWI